MCGFRLLTGGSPDWFMQNVQFSCFLLSYVVALCFEVVAVTRRVNWARVLGPAVVVAGLVAHTAFLMTRSREVNLPPLLSSTRDWLLVLAWLTVLLYLAILALDRGLPLGVFMLPVVIALTIIAWFSDTAPNSLIVDTALRRWGMLHAATLSVGSGGVLLGFVVSMMYLIQHRRLRSKTSGASLRLPSLEKLASINWWAVVIAVPLLTFGLIAGVILSRLSEDVTRVFSFADPTVIAHLVVWSIMAILFFRVLRQRSSSGRGVARQTVWAFGFLIAAIVGLQLLTGDGRLSTFHSSDSRSAADRAP